jgi:predicted nucleic acid-binding protein
MRILLDTNVVGRLSQPEHELYPIAVAAVDRLIGAGHELRVVPQVLYEFWAIATRTLAENGLGFSIQQTQWELARIKLIFPPLHDDRGILEAWESLVVAHAVRGKNTHDARLVAAMQHHAVTQLLTFDASDFARYPMITVIDPRVVGVR